MHRREHIKPSYKVLANYWDLHEVCAWAQTFQEKEIVYAKVQRQRRQ